MDRDFEQKIRNFCVWLVIVACLITGFLLYYVVSTEYHRDTPPRILPNNLEEIE